MNITPTRTTAATINVMPIADSSSLRYRTRGVQFLRTKRTFRALSALLIAIVVSLLLWALLYLVGDIFL